MQPLRLAAVVAALLVASACGGSPASPGPAAPGGTRRHFHFTTAPVELNALLTLGQIGYGLSADIRSEVSFSSGSRDPRVYAPAEGVVTGVTVGSSSSRIDFSAAQGFGFYLTGLASVSVAVGESVAPGQVVGQRRSEFRAGLHGIGLGLTNPRLTIGFINPARYPDDVLHCDAPIEYFEEPLKSHLVASVLRGPPPASTEASLNYDVPGRLQGHWYLNSLPPSDSLLPENYKARLSFFVSVEEPTTLRAFFFDPLLLTVSGPIRSDSPQPRDVSVSSGVVRYHFNPYGGGAGIDLLVQMLSDTSLRAEAFDRYYVASPVFTVKARIYVR